MKQKIQTRYYTWRDNYSVYCITDVAYEVADIEVTFRFISNNKNIKKTYNLGSLFGSIPFTANLIDELGGYFKLELTKEFFKYCGEVESIKSKDNIKYQKYLKKHRERFPEYKKLMSDNKDEEYKKLVEGLLSSTADIKKKKDLLKKYILYVDIINDIKKLTVNDQEKIYMVENLKKLIDLF